MALPRNAAPGEAAGQAAQLTGRGGVLVMAGAYLIGILAATWLGWSVLAGLGFVAGCVLAARYTRPADLLPVVVCPPMLFLGVLLFVNAMTGSGGFFLSVVLGTVVTLASVAPWLVIGLLIGLVIAWIRGLPGCIADLLRALRHEPGPARAGIAPGQAARRTSPAGAGQRDPRARNAQRERRPDGTQAQRPAESEQPGRVTAGNQQQRAAAGE